MKHLSILGLLTFAVVSSAHAGIKSEALDYSLGEANFKGVVYYNDAVKGKQPAVIVVHEWWGLNDYAKKRAKMLAEEGYVAFAVDMYGDGKVTKDPKQAGEWASAVYKDGIMRARIVNAFEVIKKHERVDPKRIGAIGYCFGGATVLELARSGADVKGVVSFHGALKTAQPAKKGEVKAAVMVCHGAVDPFVPAKEVAAFLKEMEDAGVDYQLIMFGGAVHSFTNVEADNYNIPGAGYDKKADTRSWEMMEEFFETLLGTDDD